MDPTNWVDLLFTYGPYAVLALFGLWIAPRQTKLLLSSNREDKVAHYLCAGIATGTWLVAAAMVWFIYSSWPPKQVYEGSLGTYDENTQFYPSHPDFFIATSSARGNNRLHWKFAIVTRSGKIGDEEVYTFSRNLNGVFYDYEIPAKLLKERKLRLFSRPENPNSLFYDDDGDRSTPAVEYKPVYAATTTTEPSPGWLDAYAQENQERQVIQQLRSPNPFFRAQGRAKLRRMPPEELPRLIESEALPPDLQRELKARSTEREARPPDNR